MLNFAVLHGCHEAIEFLLKIDSNYSLSENIGNKTIQTAALNTKDNSGNTSMHLAAVNGDIKIFMLLLMSGGNIQQKNKFGKSPMDLVREHNHKHIIKYLKENYELTD